MHKSITVKRLREAMVNDYVFLMPGFCCACGEQDDFVKPGTMGDKCPNCKVNAVYAAELLGEMRSAGYRTIRDPLPDGSREARPDDPIYKLGYVIGGTYSRGSSKTTPPKGPPSPKDPVLDRLLKEMEESVPHQSGKTDE